jgi:hypothetical protein
MTAIRVDFRLFRMAPRHRSRLRSPAVATRAATATPEPDGEDARNQHHAGRSMRRNACSPPLVRCMYDSPWQNPARS